MFDKKQAFIFYNSQQIFFIAKYDFWYAHKKTGE